MRAAVRWSFVLLALSIGIPAALRAAAPQVFEPGNGVSLPVVVSSVKPEYTPQAMEARIEGTVLLECVVGAVGKVGDVTVARSLDDKLGLDRQAVDALKQWVFEPGARDGKPVPVRVHVEMAFTLK